MNGKYTEIAKVTLYVLCYPFLFSLIVSVIFGLLTAWISIGKKRIARAIGCSGIFAACVRAIGFCGMFATYGLALGFFASASKEPIVGTIISSVMTFLSGYFVYMLSKEMQPRIKAIIPGAVICFITSLLYSAAFMAKYNTTS